MLFCIPWLANNVLKHIVIYSVIFSRNFVCSSLEKNLMECSEKKMVLSVEIKLGFVMS